jgi:uncharacterized protein YecA (UPF0149 family)
LPKDNKIRRGNWEAAEPSSAQIKYAALDAFVSLEMYNKVKDVKLRQKVNNKTPIGAFVAIYALTSSKAKPAAYGNLCAEDDTYEGESDLAARNNGIMVVVNVVKVLFLI